MVHRWGTDVAGGWDGDVAGTDRDKKICETIPYCTLLPCRIAVAL